MPDLAAPSAVGIPNPRIVVALSGSELEPCLSALSNGRIGLEIQDFAYPGVLDGDWREVVATYRRLRADWTGPVSLHGPIYDLNPASLEPQLVELTRRRYGLVLEIAAELQAERVVLHTQFNPCLRHPSYPTRWIAQNAAFWRQLLADPLGPIVVLENMWDVCPDHLADLIDEVDCPRLRACLDTGHARLFSHVPLRGWVGRLGERIDYVHLTDNHGGWDEHLAIGAGSIDFEPFFAELIARGINPIFVPEVGTNDEVLRSLKALGWDSALSRED